MLTIQEQGIKSCIDNHESLVVFLLMISEAFTNAFFTDKQE